MCWLYNLVQHKSLVLKARLCYLDFKDYVPIFTNDPCLRSLSIRIVLFVYKENTVALVLKWAIPEKNLEMHTH